MSGPAVTRRALLAVSSVAAAALGGVVPALSASTRPQVTGLRVDGLTRPLGLDAPRPRLSWRIGGNAGTRRQGAYRIMVASDQVQLAAGNADLWNSGKVASESSLDIVYAGKPLEARQRCYWRVEAWDSKGKRFDPSPTDWWEMGLLTPSDWSAGWLAAEDPISKADRAAGLNWVWGSTAQDKMPRRFRWSLNLARKPASATLLIAAREQLRELWLDGRPVPFTPFKKGPVDFWRMVTVPLALKAGRNVLGVEAAWVPDGFPASGGGAVVAVLRLSYEDGSEERLTSGPDWRSSAAPVKDWAKPDFDDRLWEKAQPAQAVPWGEPWPAAPATLLRREFSIDGVIARARLYATALGAYEASINGRTVDDAVLTPEATDFRERALYRTYDVTDLLRAGPNALGAHVGDGWYGSAFLLSSRFPFGPPPRRVLMQLEVEYRDGRQLVVTTGPGWSAAESPVQTSEIYDGEVYDARSAQAGWDEPGFTATAWRAAEAAPPPPCRLVAQATPPIRITERRQPVSIREVRPGVHVFDFGQNFSGWCALKGIAAAGTTIELRFAEILKADGSVDQSNLRSAEARDRYTFRGDAGGEAWRPRFTYHGFRYVEMTGWPGPLPAGILTGEVIHSDLAMTGQFRTSDRQIARIWQNTLWGQRSNFVGIPTDCPQRDERLGWMGDAQIFWDAASFNMDVAAFTRRFMGDVRDAQDGDGVFAEFAPRAWQGSSMKGAPGWADAGILLPWTVWWRYGDTAIIEDNWDAMTRYADYVARENLDFLWRRARGSDYGDWLALDAKQPGDPTTPKDLVATAFWAHVTGKLVDMATATGRTAEAARYTERRSRISRAFAEAFVKADGSIGNGSQTGYILPLRFGLVPEALRAAAADKLVADIRRRGTVLSTGFLGTPHALDVLADTEHAGLVYELLARTEFPSWGYMIAKGATTMWERWNSDVGDVSMNSFNHYALGAVVGFFYRRIAGIDAQRPGFKHIAIRPLPGPKLIGAAADYDSVMGRISTSWRRAGDRFVLDVTVPPNCTADVELPTIAGGKAVTNRHPVANKPDFQAVTPDVLRATVGAGLYQFETSIKS